MELTIIQIYLCKNLQLSPTRIGLVQTKLSQFSKIRKRHSSKLGLEYAYKCFSHRKNPLNCLHIHESPGHGN